MQKIRNFSLDQAVRATAGAGKTTGLIGAVESCYKSHFQKYGVSPHILLTTFTIKAANELSERLLDYALKKNDRDFLNYVSSHYLEVGTMHSTFMKVLSNITQDEVGEDLKSFQTVKFSQARKILHKIALEKNVEDIFELAGNDKELVAVFLKIFENSHLSLNIVSKEDLKLNLIKNTEATVESGESPFIESVAANFEVLKASLKGEEFWSCIDSFKLLMTEKISQKCKRDEKSFYRKVLKSLDVPEANQKFFNDYFYAQENIFECYKEWSVQYKEALEDKLGFGISDIEWRLQSEVSKSEESLDLWDYCFFDEYQDTSPIQKIVLEGLTKNTPCCFVGDPFQSIYYFRGARKDIFLKDFEEVSSQGGEVEFRLDNYRSSKEVVDFVNTLCEHRLSGFKPMISKKETTGNVEVFHSEEAVLNDEFEYIYSQIIKTDLATESFAVLSRNAKELMLYGRFLKARGVSTSISLSKSFENSLEVVDLCGITTFVNYPHDDVNLINLIRSPWSNFSDSELKRFMALSKAQETSVWEIVKDETEVSLFHTLIEDYKSLNNNEVLVNFLGYSDFLNATEYLDPTGKRETNIWKFIGILQTEENNQKFNVRAFTEDILGGLYPLEKDSSEPESGCVLMTVHASKGLQFDHVAIIGANKSFSARSGNIVVDEKKSTFSVKTLFEEQKKKVFPDYFERVLLEDKMELAQESRRLLYVAMTRAVKNLYIVGSGKIAKSPFEFSWLKTVLDFKDEGVFSLVDSYQVVESKSSDANEKGFLLNKERFTATEVESAAVTKKLGEETDKEEVESKVELSKLSSNIVRGTLFHEFVERSVSNKNLESPVNNFFEEEVLDNHGALNYLSEQSDFPYDELMLNGEREWGFDYIDDQGIFSSGKIDLWGIVGNQIWIVDFKTGQSKYREKGFKQLEFYADVLKKHIKNPGFEFFLVLTFPFIEFTEKRQLL